MSREPGSHLTPQVSFSPSLVIALTTLMLILLDYGYGLDRLLVGHARDE